MLYAIIYKHDDNDFELWIPDLPATDEMDVEAMLSEYMYSGCSIRGQMDEIIEEL